MYPEIDFFPLVFLSVALFVELGCAFAVCLFFELDVSKLIYAGNWKMAISVFATVVDRFKAASCGNCLFLSLMHVVAALVTGPLSSKSQGVENVA